MKPALDTMPKSAPDIFHGDKVSDGEVHMTQGCVTHKIAPTPSILDFMSEGEIKRLTKANTRKNLGDHRKQTLRAHLSRIMRRGAPTTADDRHEDDEAATPHSMQATPIVDPVYTAADSVRLTRSTLAAALARPPPPKVLLEELSTPVSPTGQHDAFIDDALAGDVPVRDAPPDATSAAAHPSASTDGDGDGDGDDDGDGVADADDDMTFEADPDADAPFSESNAPFGAPAGDAHVRCVRINSRVRVVDYFKQKALLSPTVSNERDGPSSNGLRFWKSLSDNSKSPSGSSGSFGGRGKQGSGKQGSGKKKHTAYLQKEHVSRSASANDVRSLGSIGPRSTSLNNAAGEFRSPYGRRASEVSHLRAE